MGMLDSLHTVQQSPLARNELTQHCRALQTGAQLQHAASLPCHAFGLLQPLQSLAAESHCQRTFAHSTPTTCCARFLPIGTLTLHSYFSDEWIKLLVGHRD